MFTTPTVAAFKSRFVRDFNYAPETDQSNLQYVLDADITNAYNLALLNFNPGLYGTEAQSTEVFMWLSAFYLVFSIQTSSAGLSSQSNFPISSKSVGGVSISFNIPEVYMKDPVLSQYTQNGYGMMYLNLVMQYMVGNVRIAPGTTTWD